MDHSSESRFLGTSRPFLFLLYVTGCGKQGQQTFSVLSVCEQLFELQSFQ